MISVSEGLFGRQTFPTRCRAGRGHISLPPKHSGSLKCCDALTNPTAPLPGSDLSSSCLESFAGAMSVLTSRPPRPRTMAKQRNQIFNQSRNRGDRLASQATSSNGDFRKTKTCWEFHSLFRISCSGSRIPTDHYRKINAVLSFSVSFAVRWCLKGTCEEKMQVENLWFVYNRSRILFP